MNETGRFFGGADYKITVNEAKAVLTDGDPLIINDSMSNNMTYMSGSMVIKTEDVSTIKGRIDFRDYFCRKIPNGQHNKFLCSFSEFEFDNKIPFTLPL